MRRIKFLTLVIVVISFLFVEFFPGNAEAIPAFARKYKTSCITCHATFPRLTALGEAVRLNGYKMPDGDELYVKDQPVVMGVEAYKKVFPQAVWPSDIPGLPPIAIRVTQDVEFDTGGTKDSSVTFNTPQAKILSAGSLGQDMSFFTEIEFEDESTQLSAWFMWEDWFSNAIGDNHLNFRIGSIGMQDLALPNTRNHNRITREGYLYADEVQLHAHGSSSIGIELNGFDKWWRYNAGIMQGDGATDKKNFYGALSFKIGGLGYDGSGGTSEEGGLETTPSGYWRDDSVLFGIFGMRSYVGDEDEKFDRIGVDSRINYKDISIAAGYIRGIDVQEAAHGEGHEEEVEEHEEEGEEHEGMEEMEGMEEGDIDKNLWFVELEYFVYPWLQPYVRYEHLSVDGSDDSDKARFIIGTVILARANVKFNVEGRFYTENEPLVAAGGDKNDDNLIALRLDYAF